MEERIISKAYAILAIAVLAILWLLVLFGAVIGRLLTELLFKN